MNNQVKITKLEKVKLLLLVLDNINWLTYKQIQDKLLVRISIGEISLLLYKELNNLIEYKSEVYGDKHWQIRILIKLK